MDLMSKIPTSAPPLTDRPRSDYPLSGDKTGPAWRAAWDALREGYAKQGEYLPSSVIAEYAVERAGSNADTVKNILLSAYRHGVVVKEYVVHNSRTQAAYRISDKWIKGL